jgi:hypothetical protein
MGEELSLEVATIMRGTEHTDIRPDITKEAFMLLYYFQVQLADFNEGPVEGSLELADLSAAWEEGVRTCGQLLGKYGTRFKPDSDPSIQVQDEGSQHPWLNQDHWQHCSRIIGLIRRALPATQPCAFGKLTMSHMLPDLRADVDVELGAARQRMDPLWAGGIGRQACPP